MGKVTLKFTAVNYDDRSELARKPARLVAAVRSLWTASLLVVVLFSACSKPGMPLQPGGTLSPAERRSLAEFDPRLANWEPDLSAVWNRDRMVRHVYLEYSFFSGVRSSCPVFVFDGGGRLDEANYVGGDATRSATVEAVSPLRLADKNERDRKFPLQTSFAYATWRQDLKASLDRSERKLDAVRAWRASGSTSWDELPQFLERAQTNSANASYPTGVVTVPPQQ